VSTQVLPAEEVYQDQRRRPGRPRRVPIAFAGALAVGTLLRLWLLGSSPGWQFDEAVYWRVSANYQTGSLAEHAVFGQPWQPFLYQPPVYFTLMARWFDLVGASIYHARLFGVGCTAVMLVLLFCLLRRLHGPRAALMAVVPVVFDGWLLYIERVSYIENALVILVTGGLLLYQWALDRPAWWRFLLAGMALGAAGSFKQTGVYVIVAALLCGVITKRERRGHLILLGGALLVIAVYVAVMTSVYDAPGHAWFLDQSLVQFRRVLGLQKSGGTLTSPAHALHLLTAQYKYFIPSAALAAWAFCIALRRTWQCYRARDWAPAAPNALLYSWLVTAVVVFGVSSLKFPQYFVLVLLPAYCYLWTELARWQRGLTWKRAWPAVAVAAGIGSFLLSLSAFSGNALAQVQEYAAGQLPTNAVVVTEESVGDLINQPWCTVEQTEGCVGYASYAITWQTYLQSSFDLGDAGFAALMPGATPVKSFSGAAGTATVWKLKPASS
jgi:4-amino-4-deoxy-L-arabinose transferase-like glycosyltransferase